MYPGKPNLTFEALSGGVLVPTLTPFDEAGDVMFSSVTDQAQRLTRIKGVLGLAVNATIRERLSLSDVSAYGSN